MLKKLVMKSNVESPYDRLQAAIAQYAPQARRIAVCDGPNKLPHPGASELEFWLMPHKDAPRLVIIQRHTATGRGGFDAYFQQACDKTAPAIAEIIGRHLPELEHKFVGVGQCPVCGHHGVDCTGTIGP